MLSTLPTQTAIAKLIHQSQAILFDLDGTLWHATDAIPGAIKLIELLRQRDIAIRFITNTSLRSAAQLREKLIATGFADVTEPECVPSGVFAADFVTREHGPGLHWLVLGGEGLADEMLLRGHTVGWVGGDEPAGPMLDERSIQRVSEDTARARYDGVLVGWDHNFSFAKMTRVCAVFQENRDALFYATNADPFDRVAGRLVPGNGAQLAALEAVVAGGGCRWREGRPGALGPRARVLGKPNAEMAEKVAEWGGFEPARCVVVGDRLDSDILLADRAGMKSLHVSKSGVHGVDAQAEYGISPTHTVDNVSEILSCMLIHGGKYGEEERPNAAL